MHKLQAPKKSTEEKKGVPVLIQAWEAPFFISDGKSADYYIHSL